MFDWQAFHFLRPEWLLALIPLALLTFVHFKQKANTSAWSKICDSHLLQHLLVNQGKQSSQTPLWLLACAWILTTIALAGPTWSKLEQPLFRSEDALVIVLDLSRSMDANDISPSRLNLTKFKLIDLLKKQQEGKTGLIVYAAEPYVVAPLTDDADTIISQVPALETALMPKQGSRADLALQKAKDLMKQSGVPQGHILLVTDGIESSPNALQIAKDLKQRNIKTSVLAVGTTEGAPVPISSGGFLKDNTGAIVIPQLDPLSLQDLANIGGGLYQTISSDKRDINRLSPYFSAQGNIDDAEDKKQTSDMWKEQGPWLVLLILPLAALAFRRGWIAVFFAALLLPPQPSYAFEWQDLWLTPNQQAAKAIEQQDSETAAKLFEDQRWKGSALYRQENYEQAAQHFANFNDPDSHYNRANALARAGQLQEALDAYDEALKQAPSHEDALFNRNIVEKLLQQQQQSQNSDSNENQEGNQSQQQDSQQQRGNQNNSEQNQSQQSQQQSDSQKSQQQQSQQTQNEQGNEEEQQAQSTAEENNQEQGEEQTQQQLAQEEQESEEQQQGRSPESITQANLENQQAVEQWLRRIPDDPGGLLRRKFIREHQKERANPSANVNEQPW